MSPCAILRAEMIHEQHGHEHALNAQYSLDFRPVNVHRRLNDAPWLSDHDTALLFLIIRAGCTLPVPGVLQLEDSVRRYIIELLNICLVCVHSLWLKNDVSRSEPVGAGWQLKAEVGGGLKLACWTYVQVSLCVTRCSVLTTKVSVQVSHKIMKHLQEAALFQAPIIRAGFTLMTEEVKPGLTSVRSLSLSRPTEVRRLSHLIWGQSGYWLQVGDGNIRQILTKLDWFCWLCVSAVCCCVYPQYLQCVVVCICSVLLCVSTVCCCVYLSWVLIKDEIDCGPTFLSRNASVSQYTIILWMG